MKRITGVLVILAVCAVLVYFFGGVREYYKNGQTFLFSQPSEITVVDEGRLPFRSVTFPKILPLRNSAESTVTSSFSTGSVLRVEINKYIKDRNWGYKGQIITCLRVDSRKESESRPSHTFFFYLDKPINNLNEKKEVTIKLTSFNLNESGASVWYYEDGKSFWLREFYDVEVVE